MPVAKAYAKASAQIEADKAYSVEEAVDLAKRVAHAKFDETVELAVRLGVNPKHADQMVRGAVLLPHGTGKTIPGCDHFSAIPHALTKAAVFDFLDGMLDDDFPPFE